SLAQKLGIRNNIKQLRRGAIQQHDFADPAVRVYRNRALLHDHFVTVDGGSDILGDRFHVGEVGVSILFWRRANGDKNYLAAMNSIGKVADKVKTLAAMSFQKLGKKLLMDRAFSVLQCRQFSLIVIDQHHVMPEFGKTCSGD